MEIEGREAENDKMERGGEHDKDEELKIRRKNERIKKIE